MGKVQLTRGRVVGGQNAQDLSPAAVRDQNYKFVYDRFSARPIFQDQDGDGSPTGSAGDENIIVSEGYHFEYHVIGTQTILFPAYSAAKGLQLVQDETSGDGSEVSLGLGSNGRGAFTVGTDKCYFKAKLELNDVSGIAECAVGFRRQAAYQAAIDNYTDMAVINIQAAVINIETILNNAATTTTDTTLTDWVDDATHDLEVRVDSSGVVTFRYDDAVPTVTAAFTFDDGDVIMPFIYQTLGVTAANNIYVKEWQSGIGDRSV